MFIQEHRFCILNLSSLLEFDVSLDLWQETIFETQI